MTDIDALAAALIVGAVVLTLRACRAIRSPR